MSFCFECEWEGITVSFVSREPLVVIPGPPFLILVLLMVSTGQIDSLWSRKY